MRTASTVANSELHSGSGYTWRGHMYGVGTCVWSGDVCMEWGRVYRVGTRVRSEDVCKE